MYIDCLNICKSEILYMCIVVIYENKYFFVYNNNISDCYFQIHFFMALFKMMEKALIKMLQKLKL